MKASNTDDKLPGSPRPLKRVLIEADTPAVQRIVLLSTTLTSSDALQIKVDGANNEDRSKEWSVRVRPVETNKPGLQVRYRIIRLWHGRA
jgi:hypothetical protein